MLNLLLSHLGLGNAATPSEDLPCCAADPAANGEKQREGTLPRNHLVLLPGNHPQSIRVRRLAAGLIAVACDDANYLSPRIRRPFRGVDWSVGVLVDDAWYVNASTTAGGRIFVTAGLLCYKDAVMATVLAHEIGHVIARHHERRMRSWAMAGFLANFAGELLDAPPGPGDRETRNALWLLFMRPWYYRDEYEADRLGMLLLAAAGYDPRAVVTTQRWLWIQELGENSVLNDDDLRCTHPASEKRLERLSQPKVMDQALDLYKQAASRSRSPSARQG